MGDNGELKVAIFLILSYAASFYYRKLKNVEAKKFLGSMLGFSVIVSIYKEYAVVVYCAFLISYLMIKLIGRSERSHKIKSSIHS